MEELIQYIPEHWLVWITCLVTVCAAISVVLPAPGEKHNKVYKAFYRVIQWVALNLGKAKNAGDPKTGTQAMPGKTDGQK